MFGLRRSSAGGSVSSTPSSPPPSTQQGPGSNSSTPFNTLKDAPTTRKASKDVKGSKRRSTSSSSSGGYKCRDFNSTADTYSSGRGNSKARGYFSRGSSRRDGQNNTPFPGSFNEAVKLSSSSSSSSVAEGLSRDQQHRPLSKTQPDYRANLPLPVKLHHKDTSPQLPALLTAVTSPSPAKSTVSTGTMTAPEVPTGSTSTGLEESTVLGLLLLLPEQAVFKPVEIEDALVVSQDLGTQPEQALTTPVGDVLVVSQELDKARTTVEAVLFRSRVLEAKYAALRAAFIGMKQELSCAKVDLAATKEALVCSQSQTAAVVAQCGALEQTCMQAVPQIAQLVQDYDGMAAGMYSLSMGSCQLVETNIELTAENEGLVCALQQTTADCLGAAAELASCKEELSAVQSGVSAVVSVALQLQQDIQELVGTVVNLQVELAATQEALGHSQSQTAAVAAQYGALEQTCMQAVPQVAQLVQDYDGMAAEMYSLSLGSCQLMEVNVEVTAERDEAVQGLQLLAECCVAQDAELTQCKEKLAAAQSEAAVQRQEMLLFQQNNQQLHIAVASLQAQCAARDECILAVYQDLAPYIAQLQDDSATLSAEVSLLSSSNTSLVDANMELTAERDEALEALGLVVECYKAQSAEQAERFMQCSAERDEAVQGLSVALEALLTQEVELQQQREELAAAKSKAAALRREVLQPERAKRGLKDVWVARGVLLREKRAEVSALKAALMAAQLATDVAALRL